MIRTSLLPAVLVLVPLSGAARAGDLAGTALRTEVRKYLTRYEAEFLAAHRARAETRWQALTGTGAPEEAEARERAAELQWAAFAGSLENIELSRTYLRASRELAPVDQRRLARIAYDAAGAPRIVADLVLKRIDARLEAQRRFWDWKWTIGGAPVARAEFTRILREERDLALRRAAWEGLHEPGTAQKRTLERQRWLSNEVVRALGEPDFFAWRARENGMTVPDLNRLLDGLLREIRPLHVELHTWLRYELARFHARPVPDLLPAHWLPAPGDEEALLGWLGFAPFAAIDAALSGDGPRGLVERADASLASLGLAPLPRVFLDQSVFEPGASGFELLDFDRGGDLRAHFTAGPDARGLFTAFELAGLAHCTLLTVQTDVPVLLRTSPGRALHRSLARALALAGTRTSSLASAGLAVGSGGDAAVAVQLAEALRFVLPIARAAGTHSDFERALYRDELPPEEWNARYWRDAARFEGIAPPAPRDERWCDPAALPTFFAEPAASYDDALATVIAFELFDHVARKLLDQDPHAANVHGRRVAGDFVKSIARFGATVDWRTKLREKLGYEVSAHPLVDYFAPLQEWLARANAGRRATLPSSPP